MNKLLFFIVALLMTNIGIAQTAVNFNCNDCAGNNHDFFTELDAGKVIVLCWVMPCSSCVGPALTTYNVVESFAATNPDKVFMYLVDDYANTSCASLRGWANSNGIGSEIIFSDASIKMTDYGIVGMPKIVVVGDVDHAVFYNANNSVNATQLQAAIAEAIAATTTGFGDLTGPISSVSLYPNPANSSSSLYFSVSKPASVKVNIYNQSGLKISETVYNGLMPGENKVEISTAGLSKGIYFVKISDGIGSKSIKLSVAY
jgi:hypothetical protein